MNHKLKLSLILFLIQSSLLLAQSDVLAAAGGRRNTNSAPPKTTQPSAGAWYDATRVSLTTQLEGVTDTMSFEISGEDLKITVNSKSKQGQQETAEIMLINGQCQWMLAKGAPLEKGYEIDALDAPVLDLKLAMELLRAAAPEGPTQITTSTTFDLHEKARQINVNTASASGGLEAPWTLRGTIAPAGADKWFFDLIVKHDQPMHFTGTWQKETPTPTFADDMSLDGWQILSIGPIKRVEGNSTILDYGAEPSRQHPKTLGELRKLAIR